LVLLAILMGLRHPGKTPSIGMVYIPGGTFMMGREASPDRAERPAHYVTVAPFYLDKTPVTDADYAEFMQATLDMAGGDLSG
jgi:formylglycine-generating enzyme required for sulfatase activity